MDKESRSRLLLIEGVPGIGKSTTLDQLLRRYVAGEEEGKLRTVMNLAQTHTYGPLAAGEDSGELTGRECLDHIAGIVRWLEWLARGTRRESRTKTFILVDTLHLTHCLRPGVVEWEEVATFDQRLAGIGCKLLLLDAEDETVRTRTVGWRAGTEFIRGYALGRFGRDEAELVRHFQRERDRFRQMFAESAMRKMLLRAEASIEEVASEAGRFWLAP
jgi:hypothetical protein